MVYDSSNTNKEVYFGADTSEKLVTYMEQKAVNWFTKIINNNHFDKIKASWQAYYGIYYNYNHTVSFSGEQGELANIAVNHYRNIGQHMVQMITASRPSFQARAANIDAKSQIQTKLANGILDYYMRDKKLDQVFARAAEYAVILSAGYIKMDWDATGGQVYDYIKPMRYDSATDKMVPETDPVTGEELEGVPVYEGDVVFRNLSPFEVVFDSSKDTADNHDWVLTRCFKNKFDMMAKYPELADQIREVEIVGREGANQIMFAAFDSTSEIPVYEFYHKRTPALPQGRYVVYLTPQVILEDHPIPYRELPVYRVSPSDVMGTPYGYTIMFDLLPLQEALNTTHSTALTNIAAHGVQNILNPRGNGVIIEEIEGGLNWIDYDKEIGAPSLLNLLGTPAEVYKYMDMLKAEMETISAVNSVVRGDPQASLKSGTSLALVQSQALQFISSLQHSYTSVIESVGTGLINLLRDFGAVPRIAAITGIANKSQMVEFRGDDISLVNRVIVDSGNPLMNTPAGRSSIAQDLLQMGLITTSQEYLSVITTGKLESMINGQVNDLIFVKDENERLLNNDGPVSALSIDPHIIHLQEHRSLLSDTSLRHDPDLVKRVMAHIQDHMDLLKTTDPAMLKVFNEPSFAQPAPQGPPQQPQQAPPQQMQPQHQQVMHHHIAAGQNIHNIQQNPNAPMTRPALLPNAPKPPAPTSAPIQS